ncbi:TPA: fimbrial protein [Klebsiella aerogenes]
MNKKYSRTYLLLCISFIPFVNSYAARESTADFTVTYTYSAPSCDVTSAESNSVQMGTYWYEKFSEIGQETDPVTFHILLNCNRDIYDGIEVKFSGVTASDGSGDVLALDNTDDESTAQGIGVVIYDQNGNIIPIGQDSEAYKLLAEIMILNSRLVTEL